jgi:alkanesulfonate monooxygenase SsuD/methylene tetrahydromethanopterin reductase-like flavin-dependent oxidoreductase (luciferase family)
MANHGTDPRRRFALLEENVRAIKAIWTEPEASYHGRYVNFEPIWAWPKPVQRPHPPVLVGGNGPRVIERVLAYGDEWLPEPEDGLIDRIAELQARAGSLGRGPVPVTVYGAAVGDVESYARAGVHRCVYWLPPRDRSATADRVEELAASVLRSEPVR